MLSVVILRLLMPSVVILSISVLNVAFVLVMLDVAFSYCFAECHYAEWRIFFVLC